MLAVPLLGSTVNHFFEFARPSAEGNAGLEMLESLRDSGLMLWVALGHGAIGCSLLVPRTRFLAALFQLPVSLGIVAFNLTFYPPGVPLALAMLAANLVLTLDPARLRSVIRVPIPSA